MADSPIVLSQDEIKSRIYSLRGMHVMLDEDLADIYNVKTQVLNQAVKRNIERFPNRFMFQISKEEYKILTSQFVISSSDNLKSQFATSRYNYGGRRCKKVGF